MMDWNKEKEQVSQELKDNALFKGLFEAVIKLTEENKHLRASIDNLRDNHTAKKNESGEYPKERGKMSGIITIRELTQVNREGLPVCYFCKNELCKGWPNRHIFFSCNPRCATEMEKLMVQAVYKYWNERNENQK